MLNNKKKSNSIQFRRFFSRVSCFFIQSAALWRWLAVVAGIALFIWLFHFVVSVYISGGSVFGKNIECAKITRIDVRPCSTLRREELLKLLDLREGMPFYACDSLSGKINEIMELIPTISAIEVSRKTSGVVNIVVTERIPIARFQSARLALAVDASGVVFSSRSNDRVPELLGFPKDVVVPGTNLNTMAQSSYIAALQLVEYIKEINGNINGTVFTLASVDVSNTYRLNCVFSVQDNSIYVDLWWPGMGERTPDSAKSLASQLKVLEKTYVHPQSSGGRRFILTQLNTCYVK